MTTPRPFQTLNPNEQLLHLEKMLKAALHEGQKQGKVPDLTPDQENEMIQTLAKNLMETKNAMGSKKFEELLQPENRDVLIEGYARAVNDPKFKYLMENNNLINLMVTSDKDMTRDLGKVFTQLKSDLMEEHKKIFGPELAYKPIEAIMAFKNDLRLEDKAAEPNMENALFKDLMATLFLTQKAKFDSDVQNLYIAEFGKASLEADAATTVLHEVAQMDQVLAKSDDNTNESIQEKIDERLLEEEQPAEDVGDALESATDLGLSMLAPEPTDSNASEEEETEEEIQAEKPEETSGNADVVNEDSEEEEEQQTAMRRPSPFKTKPHP